jgi:hypothetical protein
MIGMRILSEIQAKYLCLGVCLSPLLKQPCCAGAAIQLYAWRRWILGNTRCGTFLEEDLRCLN